MTDKTTIHPTASEAVLRELTERLLGTRARDRAELEQIHRELLAADPEYHRYDRVQQVLDYLELPYKVLSCRMLAMLSLRADHVVIVNCPGRFTGDGIEKLRRFVAAGGTLITTDWALETTIVRAFPGACCASSSARPSASTAPP